MIAIIWQIKQTIKCSINSIHDKPTN